MVLALHKPGVSCLQRRTLPKASRQFRGGGFQPPVRKLPILRRASREAVPIGRRTARQPVRYDRLASALRKSDQEARALLPEGPKPHPTWICACAVAGELPPTLIFSRSR